jgi:hypothetical protein
MGEIARVEVRVAKWLHTHRLARRAAHCRVDCQPRYSRIDCQLTCRREEYLEPEKRQPRRFQIAGITTIHLELRHVARSRTGSGPLRLFVPGAVNSASGDAPAAGNYRWPGHLAPH